MSASKPPPTPEASADPAAVKASRPRKKKSPAPPKAQATGDEEPAEPMSEHPHVHVPQEGIHSWREFFVHIAIVSIGLLLAIGLQQTVEFFHHRGQGAQLEEQMRQTFVTNSKLIDDNIKKLDAYRAYLIDVRLVVDARIGGGSVPPAPAVSDPRNFNFIPPPDLGAYEASKANGTVALLSLDKIRLYDRIAASKGMMEVEFQRYLGAMSALRSFRSRFESTPGARFRLAQVNPAHLSAEELIEYRVLLGNIIGAAEGFKIRLRNLDLNSRAILDGAQTEGELRVALEKSLGDEASMSEPTSGIAP